MSEAVELFKAGRSLATPVLYHTTIYFKINLQNTLLLIRLFFRS